MRIKIDSMPPISQVAVHGLHADTTLSIEASTSDLVGGRCDASEVTPRQLARSSSDSRNRVTSRTMTLREAVDHYLEYRRSAISDNCRVPPRENDNIRNDEYQLNMILNRLPVDSIADLRKFHYLEFIECRMHEKSKTNGALLVSRTTALRPVKLLLTALNFAVSQDYLLANPLMGIRVRRTHTMEIRKKRRAMTVNEYVRFKAAAVSLDGDVQTMRRVFRVPQAPLYLSIFESGRRLSEMLSLEWPDVQLDTHLPCWNFWHTKGQKLSQLAGIEPEVYPIPPALVACVRELKALHERHLERQVGPGRSAHLWGRISDR